MTLFNVRYLSWCEKNVVDKSTYILQEIQVHIADITSHTDGFTHTHTLNNRMMYAKTCVTQKEYSRFFNSLRNNARAKAACVVQAFYLEKKRNLTFKYQTISLHFSKITSSRGRKKNHNDVEKGVIFVFFAFT